MHGFIYVEFEKFALSQVSFQVWDEVLADNKLEQRQYNPTTLYPDSEIKALLRSVANRTGSSQEKLLEEFGIFIVPDLMKVYRAYIQPEWRTLDLLEHA